MRNTLRIDLPVKEKRYISVSHHDNMTTIRINDPTIDELNQIEGEIAKFKMARFIIKLQEKGAKNG